MVLNQNECVLFDSIDDGKLVVEELLRDGFKFFNDHWDLATVLDIEHDYTAYGIRWIPNYKFPECLCLTSYDQLLMVYAGDPIAHDNTDEICKLITFGEFMIRTSWRHDEIDMEDLI